MKTIVVLSFVALLMSCSDEKPVKSTIDSTITKKTVVDTIKLKPAPVAKDTLVVTIKKDTTKTVKK